MMGTQRIKRRRRNLHRRDPRCHWCGNDTVLMEGHIKYPPPNMATLDHLDDRFDVNRGSYAHAERTVLACVACNNARGAIRQRELWEEQRLRSITGHLRKRLRRMAQTRPNYNPITMGL